MEPSFNSKPQKRTFDDNDYENLDNDALVHLNKNKSKRYKRLNSIEFEETSKLNSNAFDSKSMTDFCGKNVQFANVTDKSLSPISEIARSLSEKYINNGSPPPPPLNVTVARRDVTRKSDSLGANLFLSEIEVDEHSLYNDDDPVLPNTANNALQNELLLPELPTGPIKGHNMQMLQNEKQTARFNSPFLFSIEPSTDDEFMDFSQMEAVDNKTGESNVTIPKSLNSLTNNVIKNALPAITNIDVKSRRVPSARRSLSMNEFNRLDWQNAPKVLPIVAEEHNINSTSNFRLVGRSRLSTINSIIQNKRHCINDKDKENPGVFFNNFKNSGAVDINGVTQIVKPTLTKSLSMNDSEIMSALARSESKDEPVLIGDYSKPFVLPLITGQHSDLKSISSETVARLLNGEFDKEVATYKIIDCRYPYEFNSGHIHGAINLYTDEQIKNEFLTKIKTEQQHELIKIAGTKRNIIIFHCEFSSKRAPKLLRFLRNHDRDQHTTSYPALDYPEIYLLHNGYKQFYETFPQFCEPSSYTPMLDPLHLEEYKFFRSESNSLNVEGNSGLRKCRSRLML